MSQEEAASRPPLPVTWRAVGGRAGNRLENENGVGNAVGGVFVLEWEKPVHGKEANR